MASIKKKSRKRRVIDKLLAIQDAVAEAMVELCEPCPTCCPPSGPCDIGELHDYGRGEIYRCDNCDGRGYLLPTDD